MDITALARLVNGALRNVDLTTNTLVVSSIKIGNPPTELTKTALDDLLTLRTGGDISPSLHHHDGRYFTKTELQSTTGTTGSDLIGDDPSTYLNFTPVDDTVRGALQGIDAALGATSGTQVKVTSSDTTAGYLNGKLTLGFGTNPSDIIEKVIEYPGGNEQLKLNFDVTKISHSYLSDLSSDSHTQYILADGTRAFTGDMSMGGNRILNLSTVPFFSHEAASKAYVDSIAEGIKPKEAVRLATTGPITLSGFPVIDGVTVEYWDRILVKDQTNPAENGIYRALGGSWVRTNDFDQQSNLASINEIKGAYVAVTEGVENAGKIFVCVSSPLNIGTDPIHFIHFNSITSLNAGEGIELIGTTIQVDHDGQGLTFVGNSLSLELDGPTLDKSSSGLKVADGGIDTAQLATGAVTSPKIAAAAVTTSKIANAAVTESKLDDDSVSTNKIQNLAITTAKLADDAVNEDKINVSAVGAGLAGGGGTPLSVVYAPTLKTFFTAGQSFSGTTVYAVRISMASNSETANTIYAADNDTTSLDFYHCIGLVYPPSPVSPGSSIEVTLYGLITINSAFTSSDYGKAVYLDTSGALTLTPPTSPNTAVVKVGVVYDTDKVFVQPQFIGIN